MMMTCQTSTPSTTLQPKIFLLSDLHTFHHSEIYHELLDFIDQLNKSVKGVTCTAPIRVSKVVCLNSLLKVFLREFCIFRFVRN
jgi:hypothetical protein